MSLACKIYRLYHLEPSFVLIIYLKAGRCYEPHRLIIIMALLAAMFRLQMLCLIPSWKALLQVAELQNPVGVHRHHHNPANIAIFN